MTTNETRQPTVTAISPTIGPEIAPPSGVPQLANPTALAASRCGNQLLTILFIVVDSGPSPMPKITRMTNSEAKPAATAVRPQNSDHTAIASAKTSRPPTRSAAQPPTKLNSA